MKKIKISILIANYNGEKYLSKCINSCLAQNIKEQYEIIFIDDNSTDNSLSKFKKFKKMLD
jgi:glycosyltransferase involved in cell wall biosynthesis